MATREEAEAYVTAYAATALDPILTESDVTLCIDGALTIDSDGYLVTDDEYTETVDVNRATVNALDLKLAKASVYTDVSADGTTIALSQLIANLRMLRRQFLAKCLPTYTDPDVYYDNL